MVSATGKITVGRRTSPFASLTMKQASVSSTDQGGGKRRVRSRREIARLGLEPLADVSGRAARDQLAKSSGSNS
jgi:hypothetical protein